MTKIRHSWSRTVEEDEKEPPTTSVFYTFPRRCKKKTQGTNRSPPVQEFADLGQKKPR